jgi:hypothetical protein
LRGQAACRMVQSSLTGFVAGGRVLGRVFARARAAKAGLRSGGDPVPARLWQAPRRALVPGVSAVCAVDGEPGHPQASTQAACCAARARPARVCDSATPPRPPRAAVPVPETRSGTRVCPAAPGWHSEASLARCWQQQARKRGGREKERRRKKARRRSEDQAWRGAGDHTRHERDDGANSRSHDQHRPCPGTQ